VIFSFCPKFHFISSLSLPKERSSLLLALERFLSTNIRAILSEECGKIATGVEVPVPEDNQHAPRYRGVQARLNHHSIHGYLTETRM
jgi:hypothetical protein